MMDSVPRTLIADDHRLVADALNELLAEHCEMVGTVLDGSSLLSVALERRPDLIIADLSMPGLSGRLVLKGGSYISPHIAERMASTAATERPLATLTPRQREVLQFIAKGHSAKEIAVALNLSPRTVETHKYEIMRALGFRKTADLVRYATSMGLGMS